MTQDNTQAPSLSEADLSETGLPEAVAISPADVARIWAVMSHEIRTPLMGVVGMLDVLGRTSLTEEQRRIIATVEESSNALMGIIDDVLDFTKLESTKVTLDEAPTDPVALVEGAAELLAPLAAAKRLALICEIHGDVPAVLCDAPRLRQILLNIGANAIKYTEKGDVALVLTARDVGARTATLRFSVIDSGAGIPMELQGFLFEPFWQLVGRDASLGGLGGVGLGLAICRSLAEAMGGSISVDSAPGKGSCFDVDVTFKIAPDAAAPRVRLDDTEVVALHTGERGLEIALGYLRDAGAAIVLVDSLGALGRHAFNVQKKTVVLLGPDTEAEDVEATAAAFQRMGSDRISSIVWLHRGAAGNWPPQSGVRPVRADPMRRKDLFAAATRSDAARDEVGFAVVARHQARLIDPAAAVDEARADGRVILVAEDNRVNQEVLRQQLAILGYDCDIAPTGHAALKALQERTYPLLLCDCQMPGMDGFELTRIIRGNERSGGAHLPIIAVTANAVPGEATRCRAAGMDDYLAKPIEIGALQAKLNLWVGPRPSATVWRGAVSVKDNEDRILDLRNLTAVYGSDPARLAPVLDQWAGAMAEVLSDVEASIAAEAWESALAATHRIKGSAGVAGATRVSAAAAVLEVALGSRDRQAIARERDRLRTLTRAGLDEAAAWKHQVAASEKAALGGARI